jgi:SMC interacting uncharacterized protein involved in chromosome segregation
MTRRKRAEEDQPVERLLELIDEQVDARHKATLAERAATDEITRLASEARRKGATMASIANHVKKVDPDGSLSPVSRQNVDTMLAVFEKRREARTTRASRRRRTPDPAAVGGTLNVEALS